MTTTLNNLLMLAIVGLTNSANAAQTVHINIRPVDGVQQTAKVNQPLPKRFVAQVTLDDGTPVAGVNLAFSVNGCLQFSANAPGTSPCPDPSTYGHFASTALVATGADGRAVSPPFIAGKLGGTYTVYVSQPTWSQELNGKTFTYMPPSFSNLFKVTQLDASVGSVPFFSFPAALTLACLLGLAGFLSARKRSAD